MNQEKMSGVDSLKDVNSKVIRKIVLTGGPCAGKTTAIDRIQNSFGKKGYAVIVIPETATELISGGVAPWTLVSSYDYQLCQMKLQIEKEKLYKEAAYKICNSDKILIVCDRGMLDNKAYMTQQEFDRALCELNLNETELMNEYDAVFHLSTVAKEEGELYSLSNNQARTESAAEAIRIDDSLITAWVNHPYFREIESTEFVNEKMEHLISEISEFLKD